MNALWYVWTTGYGGATGEPASGPQRHGPYLAADELAARAVYEAKEADVLSWHGMVKKITTDMHYAPRPTWVW